VRTSLIQPVLEEIQADKFDKDFFGMPSIPEENAVKSKEEAKEPSP